MATCGYICPACEGRGFDENLENCLWCMPPTVLKQTEITSEDWIKQVHDGPCCGDLGIAKNNQ